MLVITLIFNRSFDCTRQFVTQIDMLVLKIMRTIGMFKT